MFRFPTLALAAALSFSAANQSPDVQRSLDEAKALYRDARFTEAAAELHEISVALKPQAHVPGARDLLADAYLYLALCHVALDSPSAAKQAFKDLLRLEPERRLDPAVYAPKVVEIFSVALDDLPEIGADAGAAGTETEIAAEKKGGSKALPILLGVGAAAGVVVAAGGSGGGDSPATSPTGVSVTPTPAPTSTPLPGDAVFQVIGLNPPQGSRFSLSDVQSVTIDFLLDSTSFGRASARVFIDDNVPQQTPETPSCSSERASDFFDPGPNIPITLDLSPFASFCNLPDDFRMEFDLFEFGSAGRSVALLELGAVYTIDP